MTYCVGIKLADGLVMASDSRTNAGVDHIATFRKMAVFEWPGEAVVVLLSAGNLATTQSTISTLRQRLQDDHEPNLRNRESMYDVAVLVGATLREIIQRDTPPAYRGEIDYGCSFLVGGQIGGEEPRLFNIYPQGNFIEATVDTPFFQIGEAKYGKPILDRVIQYDTPARQAAKCALISFDSSIRSNVSVGLPIDLVCYRRDSLVVDQVHRITEADEYFQMIRREWSRGLRETFGRIEDPPYFTEAVPEGTPGERLARQASEVAGAARARKSPPRKEAPPTAGKPGAGGGRSAGK